MANTDIKPQLIDPVELELEKPRNTKSNRIANAFIIAALVVILACLGLIFSWAYTSSEALVVKNDPFPARIVEDPTGQTGGTIYLTVDYCKNTNVKGELRVSFVSPSREQFLPLTAEDLPKGCNKMEFPVTIPVNLIPDTYMVKFRTSYDLNPLKQNVTYNFTSQGIKIGDPNRVIN